MVKGRRNIEPDYNLVEGPTVGTRPSDDSPAHLFLCRRNTVKVYGIIYLHDIARYNPTYGPGMLTPSNLSQPSLAKNITVGWTGKGIPENLQSRVHDLKAKSWGLMAKAGSQIHRFEHTHESAWNIVEEMKRTTAIPLKTFVRELEAVHNCLSQHTPRSHGHGFVAGFFSYLFGRKK